MYLVLLGVFVLQAIGVLLMPETSSPAPGALASLRPHFAVPGQSGGRCCSRCPPWSRCGPWPACTGRSGPPWSELVSGSGSVVLGGLSLFVLAGSGAVAVLLLQRQNARQLTLIGGGALLAGIALTLVAVGTRSTAGFFVGTAIAGIGFGGGFQGAIRSVMPLAAPHQRAGVLSVVYVVSYLALGLPAVVAGVLLVHGDNLLHTTVQYGVAVMVLAALALLGAIRPTRPAVETRPERDEVIEPEQAQAMRTAERVI